eukprot:9486925-Pyramimonas_sp.AAC.1
MELHRHICDTLKQAPVFSQYPPTEVKRKEWVGQGTWANVYRGTFMGVEVHVNPDGSTGLCWLQVAIKDPFDQYPSRVLTERFLREVSASRNVLHNNVAGLVGACMVAGSVSVVYEWVPYSCLRDALDQNSLSVNARLKVARELARALEWLHHGASPSVPHLDLTSYNVFVNPADNAVKLSDFGLGNLKKVNRGLPFEKKVPRAKKLLQLVVDECKAEMLTVGEVPHTPSTLSVHAALEGPHTPTTPTPTKRGLSTVSSRKREEVPKDPYLVAAMSKMAPTKQPKEAWVCPELLIFEDDPMKLPAYVRSPCKQIWPLSHFTLKRYIRRCEM